MKLKILPLNILQHIPENKITTYGDLSKIFGTTNFSREVGRQMGGNKSPDEIDCFRVVKSDLTLGGYSGGGGIDEKIFRLRSSRINISEDRIKDPEKVLWKPRIDNVYLALDFDSESKKLIANASKILEKALKLSELDYEKQNPEESYLLFKDLGDASPEEIFSVINFLKSQNFVIPEKLEVQNISSLMGDNHESVFLEVRRGQKLMDIANQTNFEFRELGERFQPHIKLFWVKDKVPGFFYNLQINFSIIPKSIGLFAEIDGAKSVKIAEFV